MSGINKLNDKVIESFIIDAGTGSIQRTEYGTRCNLFAYIDDKKKVVGYLTEKGLDPFKRGTKEPARIKEELSKATWEVVSQAQPRGRSMFE